MLTEESLKSFIYSPQEGGDFADIYIDKRH